MECEIRPLSPEDRLRHQELLSQAFERGRVAPPPAEGDSPPEWFRGTYGLFASGDGLAAAYTLLDFRAHWGADVTLPLGGIAGVATFAEARGRGHVGALLRHSLATMRERGQVVSALYPFSWEFYRRYGWDWVGERRKVTLPLREVRASPEGKNVRVLRVEAAEAAEALKPVYTRYARGYRGVFDAETHQWKDALAHSGGQTTYAYVHQPPDAEADGYFLWRYGASEGPGRVREWVANTPEAYRGLLSVLHYLGTQCEKAVLSLPAGDPLTAHLMDWDMETKVHPVFMGRVVDLPAAFAALAPAVDTPAGVALLQVRDEHAPWNEGLWRVEVGGGKADGGKVTCAPAPPGSLPALTCDIQAISQAYWGMPSLEWLRRASRVEVHDERAFQFLTTLLPGACVWTLDDF